MNSGINLLPEDAQHRVSIFTDTLWEENSSGLKQPKFSPEEAHEMAKVHFSHEQDKKWLIIGVADRLFMGEWVKLPVEVRHQVSADAAKRKLALPIEELLKTGKLGDISASTVLGRLGLIKWEASGDLETLQKATELLKSAAEEGNPEACYLLASYRPRQEFFWYSGPYPTFHYTAPEFLEMDNAIRQNYDHQSGKSRYKIEAPDEMDCVLQEDHMDRVLQADREEITSNVPRLRGIIRSDEDDLTLAKLFDKAVGWGFVPEDRREAVKQEARICLEKASSSIPEAGYLLASNYHDLPGDMRHDLYLHAAYPQNGALPFQPAFKALAHSYIERGLLDLAEKTLRDGLQNPGKQHDFIRYELAEFLRQYRFPDLAKEAEALKFYRELSDRHSCDGPWSAYCAVLLLLKRGSSQENLDEAKSLLINNLNVCSLSRSFIHFGSHDEVFFKYAEIVYELGWGRSQASIESIVDGLLSLLETSGFRGNAENLLTLETARLLMSVNTSQKGWLPEQLDKFPIDIYGKNRETLVEGMLCALQPGPLNQEEITRMLGSGTLVGEYVTSQLLVANRFDGENGEKAINGFQRTMDIGKNIARREHHAASLSKFGTQMRQRIIENSKIAEIRLRSELDRLETEQKLAQARLEATENMMAMFAHKFRGPVDSILFNTAHQHDERVYIDAARTMNGLLDIFSVVSTHPDKLLGNLKDDTSGEGSPAGVLLHAIKLALVQLLAQRNRRRMSPHYLAYAKRQGNAPEDLRLSAWTQEKSWQEMETSLQTRWEQEVGEMIVTAKLDMMGDWMAAHLFPVRVEGFAESLTQFAQYGPKASLLTVIFTEVIVNAIKHSASVALEPISLSWIEGGEETVFSCVNPSSRESRTREASKGSGRGHKFLALIADHLQGRFDADVFRDASRVTMTLPSSAMRGSGK